MPQNDFLQSVRKITDRLGAVLIFDEVTSGFRMNLGGIHLELGVHPDIVVYGKALGNGYPISAIVGRREVMDYAQETFISSTFWTERVGLVAALTTLKKMEERKVQNSLIEFGNRISNGWKSAASKAGIDVSVSGIPPLTHLSFKNDQSLEMQTLFTQEMLSMGYLAASSSYTTYGYTDQIIDKYIESCGVAFEKISNGLKSGGLRSLLWGEPASTGFKRLT
jgi:glutamate-1-semialdehyde aminotransferase